MKFILILGIFVSYAASQTPDYCDRELCKRKISEGRYTIKNHIGCRNNGDFSFACPSERSLVPMTRDIIDLILKEHNGYRSKVATGKLGGYAKASQMIEMSWNAELAKLAEFNAKTCKMAHDECRSTVRFRRPGQNLGLTMTSHKEYKSAAEIVRNHTAEWFIEYKLSDMSYIRSFRTSDEKIGHFLQMVVAGADKVGCAMTRYNDGLKNMLFACNYSLGNLLNVPIYLTGEPCSKCKSGCSRTYPGLCNTNEKELSTQKGTKTNK